MAVLSDRGVLSGSVFASLAGICILLTSSDNWLVISLFMRLISGKGNTSAKRFVSARNSDAEGAQSIMSTMSQSRLPASLRRMASMAFSGLR
ncbi:hypothetical protein DWH62_04380 [Escherichia coli]|nr:hypothetical protein [Escherichia coli]